MLSTRLQNSKRFLSDYDDFEKVLKHINNKKQKLTRKQDLYLFGIQSLSAIIPILLFLSTSILSAILLSGYTSVIMLVMIIISVLIYYKNIDYSKLLLNDIHHKIIDLKKEKEKKYLGLKHIKISISMLEKVLKDESK